MKYRYRINESSPAHSLLPTVIGGIFEVKVLFRAMMKQRRWSELVGFLGGKH
jgi:hypothetical protein